ncbi:hypothetical protein AR505_0338 [methanogenic archaeon ISO4-H5]|nr:hypothetical protein AR505_0338 [methanogenic archaeon ISO4-H5]
MPYQMYPEQPISFKKLTLPELGKKRSSHLTHIGLSNHSFAFLGDRHVADALLWYDGRIYRLPVYIDSISMLDGGSRSPKIRSGGVGDHRSVYKAIRHITGPYDAEVRWYMFYFTVDPEHLAFVLFNDQSQQFRELADRGLYNADCHDHNTMENDIIPVNDVRFGFYSEYLLNLLNNATPAFD